MQTSNKRIVLVTPPYERIAAGYEFVKTITNLQPTLGLLHLAAEVREHGYEPSIIEGDLFELTVDEVVERIVQTAPSYVGISLFTVGVHASVEIAGKVKQALPDTTIIVGGPHISSMAEETMVRYPQFDLAVLGEGEEALVILLDTLQAGGDISNVPSLLYVEKSELQSQVRRTPKLPIHRELDHLPMPAWDLLPDFPGAYLPPVYDYPRAPVASIAASRGCPFHCKFCDTSTFGAKVRAYTPPRVFEIIQHLQAEYGIRHITFVDDLFLASKKRTRALCELIIEHNVDITWSCTSRVDVVKPEILDIMKKAGCWEINFGLETGSDELLQKMDKAASIEKSKRALQWTADAGIRSKGLFMLGFPGENQQTVAATKAFLKEIPLTLMNLTKFTPYPGSPIYRELYKTTVRDDHWDKMNGMNFLYAPEGMTVKELDKTYKQLLGSFYRQPRILWHYVTFSFRYPHHLLRLAKFLLLATRAKARSYLRGRGGNLALKRNTIEASPNLKSV